MNLSRLYDWFSSNKERDMDMSALLSNPVISGITTHLINGILNEIATHCNLVASLQQKGELTPESLSSYNQKLVSMIQTLTPVLDMVKDKQPELAVLVNLAESYASAAKSN